jgi:hypothetical protein
MADPAARVLLEASAVTFLASQVRIRGEKGARTAGTGQA